MGYLIRLIAQRPRDVACCDICDPTLLARIRPGVPQTRAAKLQVPKKGLPDDSVVRNLKKWRSSVFQRDHAQSMLSPSAILDDSLMTDFASYGPVASNIAESILKDRWVWWDVYGTEFMTFIESIPRRYIAVSKTAVSQRKTRSAEDTVQPADSTDWEVEVVSISEDAVVPSAITSFVHCSFDNDSNLRELLESIGLLSMTT